MAQATKPCPAELCKYDECDRGEDEGDAFRGLGYGLVLSLPFWAAILTTVALRGCP